MKQITIFVIFVLVTGMIMPVYDDVFELNDKGQEKGKSTGCEKGTAKNNPHCSGSSSLPANTCDINNDGSITADELGFTTTFIMAIETTVLTAGGNTNSNQEIDTLDEWDAFQIEKPGLCVPDS
jgi:hypothetical protein